MCYTYLSPPIDPWLSVENGVDLRNFPDNLEGIRYRRVLKISRSTVALVLLFHFSCVGDMFLRCRRGRRLAGGDSLIVSTRAAAHARHAAHDMLASNSKTTIEFSNTRCACPRGYRKLCAVQHKQLTCRFYLTENKSPLASSTSNFLTFS